MVSTSSPPASIGFLGSMGCCAATIMEEASDEPHERQKNGRTFGGRTSLAFGNEWTAPGRIDPNNNNLQTPMGMFSYT